MLMEGKLIPTIQEIKIYLILKGIKVIITIKAFCAEVYIIIVPSKRIYNYLNLKKNSRILIKNNYSLPNFKM